MQSVAIPYDRFQSIFPWSIPMKWSVIAISDSSYTFNCTIIWKLTDMHLFRYANITESIIKFVFYRLIETVTLFPATLLNQSSIKVKLYIVNAFGRSVIFLYDAIASSSWWTNKAKSFLSSRWTATKNKHWRPGSDQLYLKLFQLELIVDPNLLTQWRYGS